MRSKRVADGNAPGIRGEIFRPHGSERRQLTVSALAAFPPPFERLCPLNPWLPAARIRRPAMHGDHLQRGAWFLGHFKAKAIAPASLPDNHPASGPGCFLHSNAPTALAFGPCSLRLACRPGGRRLICVSLMRTRTLLLAILLVLAGVSLSGQRCFALVAWDENAHSQLSTSNSSPPLLAMGARGETTAPTIGGINRDHFSFVVMIVLIACLAAFARLARGGSPWRRELQRVSERRVSVGDLSCAAVARERGPGGSADRVAPVLLQRPGSEAMAKAPAVVTVAASPPQAARHAVAGHRDFRTARQEDKPPAEKPPFCRVVAPLVIR